MAYNRFSGGGMGFSLFPPMLKMLLVLNGFIFVLDSLVFELLAFDGIPLSEYIMQYFALQPFESGLFWPWQLISYQFLHAGFSHLFFNLLALWMFGAELEQVWGSRRFITFYLISGIGGGLVHLGMQMLPGFQGAPTIGASGAVMGVLLGFGLTFPDRPVMMFPLFIPIPAKYFVLIYAGIDLFSGLFSTNSGVAHFAHLGGAFFGYMMMKHGDDLKIYAAADKLFGIFGGTSRKASNIIDYPFERNRVEVIDREPLREVPREPKGNSTGLFFEGQEITTEEIDTILEKINASGFASLTDREKRLLYEVSKRMD